MDLTERERQIMDLLAEGYSYKQVHAILHVEVHTIRIHVQNVKRKAGVSGPLHRVIIWYINQRLSRAA